MKNAIKQVVVRILTAEARAVLKKHKPKIVAITGSVGKTSTKDAIFAVMSSKLHVRKSDKSFNSEFGVPLTILGLKTAWSNPLLWLQNILMGLKPVIFRAKYPEWLVLEVGADHPGDIEKVTEWLSPDIVVITKMSEVPVHVENFSSPQAVKREKGFLAAALKREGTLILNADDEDVMSFRELAPEQDMITYGFRDGDVLASADEIGYDRAGDVEIPRGMVFRVDNKGASVPVHLYGSLGRQHIYPALAAMAVGLSLGLRLIDMAQSLGKHRGPKGRMKIVDGVKDSVVIDDTYNSSPVALKQALETLRSIKCAGKKYAVLGDMLELGKYSIEEHKKAGVEAAQCCDVLMTVGIRSRDMAESAISNGMFEGSVYQFEDSQAAGKQLELLLQKGDIALIKGSQGIRMEKAALEVIAHPEKAEDLLVRQEPEWKGR